MADTTDTTSTNSTPAPKAEPKKAPPAPKLADEHRTILERLRDDLLVRHEQEWAARLGEVLGTHRRDESGQLVATEP